MSGKTFFITGTGTDIGKTFVTRLICQQAREQGRKIAAIKPVMSGYDPQDMTHDAAMILHSLGLPVDAKHIDAIAPWRYRAPLSPDMAAAKEGRVIELEEVVSFCRLRKHDGILLIEGAGGVMSPLNDHETMIDWMAALNEPVILVSGSYLGSLSHALTAIQALQQRKLPIAAIILNESEAGTVSLEETMSSLRAQTRGQWPLITLPRIAHDGNSWKNLPDLLTILA